MAGNSSLFDLTGRVAVVTGGNRGIGRAMALGLARAGASVAVLARNAEHNQLVLAELKTVGKPALVLPLDVTDRAALGTAVAEVERALGGIDILVNNAGIVALTGGVLAVPEERQDRRLGSEQSSIKAAPTRMPVTVLVGTATGQISGSISDRPWEWASLRLAYRVRIRASHTHCRRPPNSTQSLHQN
ncbi:MAG: SDR family NAD(P)-dependent oxidoreductase [Steroidobacteraceae bacterium]